MSDAEEKVTSDAAIPLNDKAASGSLPDPPIAMERPVPEPQREIQLPPERAAPDNAAATGKSRRRSILRVTLMVLGVAVAATGSLVFWLNGGRYAGTDDANVQSAKVIVTTDVSGLVSSVNVREGQQVEKGDILFVLELHQFQIALDNAAAQLANVELTIRSMKDDYQVLLKNVAAQEAQIALDQIAYNRASTLAKENARSQADSDQARYTLEIDNHKLQSLRAQAEAQLSQLGGDPDIPVTEHPLYKQAKAQMDEAQRELDHASVRAPFAGTVTEVDDLQPGAYLVAQTAALTGAGALALVANDHVWVNAEMKETDLTFVKTGDPVTVTVDTYPGQVWNGSVDSISPASGSEFSILPAENASGNFVKVVQRIPVRILIETPSDAPALRAGMSAVVKIDTGHKRSLRDLL
ncbi:HlyD family secretion protein [Martelella soudanensis]|uniref:HlyD family secretion protein n=1 Tax=unclassified Martelella TaxID=2629616 RepID=UPI0015E03114|nr:MULTISPECIES: HlyD family secretion protein [unclassified Martelella]